MTSYAIPLLCAAIGAILAATFHPIYNKLPEHWLQDYDYDPTSESSRPARRMKFVPHTLILVPVTAALFFFGAFANPEYFARPDVFRLLLMFLPAFPFAIVVMSDYLNRIIPDHVLVFAGILSVLGFLADLTGKSLWFPDSAPVWHLVLNRLLGGVIGAALLLLIGLVGSLISRKEAMGHGDVKFILVCGLLSGAYGLIFVLFISFLIGGVVAFPLLIRKRIRIAREEKEIRESKNPARARRTLDRRRKELSFADDPDYIAFGPFLAVGTLCFLLFETPLYRYYSETIRTVLELTFK